MGGASKTCPCVHFGSWVSWWQVTWMFMGMHWFQRCVTEARSYPLLPIQSGMRVLGSYGWAYLEKQEGRGLGISSWDAVPSKEELGQVRQGKVNQTAVGPVEVDRSSCMGDQSGEEEYTHLRPCLTLSSAWFWCLESSSHWVLPHEQSLP